MTINRIRAPIATSNATPPIVPPTIGPTETSDLIGDAGGIGEFGEFVGIGWLVGDVGGRTGSGVTKSASREELSQTAVNGLQQGLVMTSHKLNL